MATKLDSSQTKTLVTGDQLLAMGDIGRCELIEGNIVRMVPPGFEHGNYEGNFYEYLKAFVRRYKLGKVVVGEVGIYTRRDPDSVRAADVAFISHERLAQRTKKRGFLDVAPELVVEVMSPDDRWSDVKQKLREYFSAGVNLVWVADPADRTVRAYRSLTDVREFTESDALTDDDDVLRGFSVSVADLFEE